jgi:ABC-type polysaccharide/polyol phosphate export permease
VIYTGLGYVLSMAAPNLRQASLYADLLWIFLIFFSPTYYSLNSVPYLLRYAFHANPVTYVSYLVRYSLTGLGDTLLISISAITQLALMVIFLAVMLRGWHWYEK